MTDTQPFFSKLSSSLSPTGYRQLRQNEPHTAILYLILLILFSLFIKAVFLIPLGIEVIDSLQNVSQKFAKASFQGAIETNEPVLIPSEQPLVQIDTSPQAVRQGSVFITTKTITFGDRLSPTTITFPDFSQAVDTNDLMTGLFVLFVFLAPSVILLLFMAGMFKAFLIGSLLGFIAFGVKKSRGKSSSLPSALAMGFYSLTSMVIIEAIIVPLRFGEYLFPMFSVLGVTFYAVSISISLCVFFIWLALAASEKYAFE